MEILMANAFDPTTAPQGEPTEITAGDLVTWRRDDLVTTYPTDTYSLSYAFQSIQNATASGNNFEITATEDVAGYYAQITGATTLALSNFGDYAWQAYITRTSDSARITVGQGRMAIRTDFDSLNQDPRNHAQVMLAKIESILEGRADSDVSNYSINGRSLVKIAIEDLLRWRDYYRAEVTRLNREEDIKLGRQVPSTIKVRF
jgi:hypothetical protein